MFVLVMSIEQDGVIFTVFTTNCDSLHLQNVLLNLQACVTYGTIKNVSKMSLIIDYRK